MAKTQTCQGKRRMWRGNRLGTYKCGRKATHIVETRVGLSQTHFVCEDDDCFRSITSGYPANSRRIGAK